MEEYVANWLLNSYCNYDCEYCFDQTLNKKDLKNIGNLDIDSPIRFFNNSKKKWIIHIGGGEPFFHPRFIELCQELSKLHKLSIITNLSSDKVYDFINLISPKSVHCINCSVHITQLEKRKKSDEFIHKYKLLKFNGFNVKATIVLWPGYLNRMKFIYKRFEKEGIILIPNKFRGTYLGRKYPDSYDLSDLKEIMIFYKKSCNKLGIIAESINYRLNNKSVSFFGYPCLAGLKHISIWPNGDVFPCHSDKKALLGNIYLNNIKMYKKPIICSSKYCDCYFQGYQFSLKRFKCKFKFLNIFSKKHF